jgi:hypothetical protein
VWDLVGGPVARLGRYRARDGSAGAPVGVDVDRPHAALVVGKRGYGKSYTLGVLAEAAATTPGIAPVVVDPMGVLGGLAAESAAVDGRVVETPRVRADALPPSSWPRLLGLDPTTPAGALIWRAADGADTLAGMRRSVAGADAAEGVRRAADNHLRLAAGWDVFDPDGLDPTGLSDGAATVLDCSSLPDAPAAALVRAVARGLYRARVDGRVARLPWLFLDEAHTFFDGVAAPALRRLLTRGRAPGVSTVVATQRPESLPDVARSQSDLLIAHRLTAEPDVEALAAAAPTYLRGSLRDRLPDGVGDVLVVDDATESVHDLRVRERVTPHGGTSPRASDVEA